uniref:Putative secreted protein n=1 Tax=Amblyomma cajennense TaxID=34607 RepID=A0A023FD78_AMBCJ
MLCFDLFLVLTWDANGTPTRPSNSSNALQVASSCIFHFAFIKSPLAMEKFSFEYTMYLHASFSVALRLSTCASANTYVRHKKEALLST